MTTQEADTTALAKKFELGVLLVHGIGAQRSGDTLVRWGDTLLKTIERAMRCRKADERRFTVTVERARPSEGPGKNSIQASVLLGAGEYKERWLISECCWADAFPAPSYRELVSWSMRALPWSIVTHITERYWHKESDRLEKKEKGSIEPFRAFCDFLQALIELFLALALAPVLVGFLGLSLLLGLLPIPQIRTAILAMQSALTATIGDSFAFVESPVRAALIKTCILDGLDRVKEDCRRTVIVAHSQGAAAVLDALRGMAPEPNQNREPETGSRAVPDALVTFGAGTKKLASQKALAVGGPPQFFWGAFVYSWLLGGVLFWLYSRVRLQQTTGEDILWGLALLVVTVVAASLLMWGATWLMKRWPTNDVRRTFVLFAAVLVPTAGLLLLYSYGSHEGLPLFQLSLLTCAGVFVVAAVNFLLWDKTFKTYVDVSVRMPPGLARWVDIYASADPVPNGKTKVADDQGFKSIEIHNLGSIFDDHTAYWDNRDGFVLRVAKICAQTANSPLSDELPCIPDFVDKHAAWRVSFLQMATWSASALWIVIGVLFWNRYQESIPMELAPGWVPTSPARLALLVIFIVLAIWATAWGLRCLWSWWVRAEQEAVLGHGLPGGEPQQWHRFFAILAMGVVVWMVFFLMWLLSVTNSQAELVLRVIDGDALRLPLSAIGGAVISTLLLLWWKRPPAAVERLTAKRQPA